MDNQKYFIVVRTCSEYDTGAPIAEIVEKKICKSYEDAYQLMKKDYDQYAIDAIESEFPEMHKYTHKCGDAYVIDDDGEILWNIEELLM